MEFIKNLWNKYFLNTTKQQKLKILRETFKELEENILKGKSTLLVLASEMPKSKRGFHIMTFTNKMTITEMRDVFAQSIVETIRECTIKGD